MSSSLAEVARRADDLVARGRAELVRAVRQAAAAGQTQAQIAAAIGRSQPEVSRLLHFHGTSPVARRLRKHAPEIKRVVADAGGSNVRVFGSVATGEDREGSDIDLLFTMGRPLSLMQLGALELSVSEIVGSPVDLVPDTVLRPIRVARSARVERRLREARSTARGLTHQGAHLLPPAYHQAKAAGLLPPPGSKPVVR